MNRVVVQIREERGFSTIWKKLAKRKPPNLNKNTLQTQIRNDVGIHAASEIMIVIVLVGKEKVENKCKIFDGLLFSLMGRKKCLLKTTFVEPDVIQTHIKIHWQFIN